MKEDEEFRSSWVNFRNALDDAIRKQKTEKTPENIEKIEKEIDDASVVLSRLQDDVFVQWRNYISKTEYKIYYKVFHRDISKTVDLWWGSIKGYISYLDRQKKRLEAIGVPTTPTGEAAPPEEAKKAEEKKKIETTEEKLGKEWWENAGRIKKQLEPTLKKLWDLKSVSMTGWKKSARIKSFLDDMHKTTEFIIQKCNDMMAVSRNPEAFKRLCNKWYHQGLFQQLSKSIKKFLGFEHDLVRILTLKSEEKIWAKDQTFIDWYNQLFDLNDDIKKDRQMIESVDIDTLIRNTIQDLEIR